MSKAEFVQFIKTPKGGELVVLPRADYEKLRRAASEEGSDVRAYDAAKRRLAAGEDELIPAEFAERLLEGDNPVRVWREYRGLSIKELAGKAGITAAYLSQIETGVREGKVSTMKAIADSLGLTVDDLI
jgi:DNA-binding XRE family transcriptional regulator